MKPGLIDPQYIKHENSLFYCYSEEYIAGPTLREMIEKRTFDPKLSLALVRHTTSAIDALWVNHQGVHRDIKPENIIYRKSKDTFVLIDTGITLIRQGTLLTPTGYVIGTLPYMSPEQIQGRRELDFRSDLYSLGLVAYECIIKKHPYVTVGMGDSEIINNILHISPPSLKGVASDFPEDFLEVIDTLLKKRPHMRFNSCKKLLEKLAKISYN